MKTEIYWLPEVIPTLPVSPLVTATIPVTLTAIEELSALATVPVTLLPLIETIWLSVMHKSHRVPVTE